MFQTKLSMFPGLKLGCTTILNNTNLPRTDDGQAAAQEKL